MLEGTTGGHLLQPSSALPVCFLGGMKAMPGVRKTCWFEEAPTKMTTSLSKVKASLF